MSPLLLALALAAPCPDPAVATLSQPTQVEACALLARPGSAVRPDRALLLAIYQRPEFLTARSRNTGALQAWLAQARAWLEKLFESSGAETYSQVTRFLVLLLGCLVVVWAGVKLLARRHREAAKPETRSEDTALELEDPSVHLGRARALLGSAPREAIREALLALLSHLERQRLARPDRVKTNRELAEELLSRGASKEVARAVTAVLSWYDAAFYSLGPVEPSEASRFVEDVARLSAQRGAPT